MDVISKDRIVKLQATFVREELFYICFEIGWIGAVEISIPCGKDLPKVLKGVRMFCYVKLLLVNCLSLTW